MKGKRVVYQCFVSFLTVDLIIMFKILIIYKYEVNSKKN